MMQSDDFVLQNVSFFINGSRTDTKSFWKNIKNCTGLGHFKSLIYLWPHATSDQAKVSANKLSQYFIKSVANITSQFPVTSLSSSSLPPISGDAEFSFVHITKFDVLAAIKTLSSTSSTFFDEITSKMLKCSTSIIATPLANIFNKSHDMRIFPYCWKQAITVLVPKRGDPYCLTNYRPISLLSTESKLLEKIVNDQLSSFIEISNGFSSHQHGFREKRSCEIALLRFTNILFRGRRNGLFFLCYYH